MVHQLPGGTAATFLSLLRRTRDTEQCRAVEIAQLHMPGNSLGTATTFRSLLRPIRDTGRFSAVEVAQLHMPGDSRGHCCNVLLAFKNEP